MASFGSVLKIWRSGITPKTTPASTETSKTTRSNEGCGMTLNVSGYSAAAASGRDR